MPPVTTTSALCLLALPYATAMKAGTGGGRKAAVPKHPIKAKAAKKGKKSNAEDILAASGLAVAPPTRAKQGAPAKPKVQATAAAPVVTRKCRSEVDEVKEEALSEVKVRELSEEEVASEFESEEIEEPKEKWKGKVVKKVFVENENAMEVDVNNDQPPSPQPAHGASRAVGGVFRGNRERFDLADAEDMMEDPPVLPINGVVFVHVSEESAAKYDLTIEKHDAKISVQVRCGMTEVLKHASRKWPSLAVLEACQCYYMSGKMVTGPLLGLMRLQQKAMRL
ncbi:hypothetical protein DFP72DRAFT_851378 [Ephemerocybe angulata]|uniref:Uncharacterized protein n=1 Tax=Ephemerocybe angulata TaxID=980116 RepID=A0A8H6HQG0_9AGAR|nr:hypothetical protein DFP72DRAFT_851378 [Tulosesus angulatus]